MRKVAVLVLALPVMVFALAGEATGHSPVESARSTLKKDRLQAFGSCSELLSYAKANGERLVTARGLGENAVVWPAPPGAVFGAPGMSIAAPSVVAGAAGTVGATGGASSSAGADQPDFSTTNVQEAGVDEPDIVKSDGSRIFTATQDKLYAIDARSASPHVLGSLPLEPGWTRELLLHGERLLVLSRGIASVQPLPAGLYGGMPRPLPISTLEEVDVSDAAAMKVVSTLELPGDYLTARLVGNEARVVTSSSMPRGLVFEGAWEPGSLEAAVAHNRELVAASTLASWVPSYVRRDAAGASTTRPLVQCKEVRRPLDFSGLGLLTVLTLDLAKGLELVDSDAVLADGGTVYASPKNLYIATQSLADRQAEGVTWSPQPNRVTTLVHKFDISKPTNTEYRASGEVAGSLLNQWSLSEHKGVLRVANTVPPGLLDSESESFVTTMVEREGRLVQLGRVGGLGKGESIFGVRFVGDIGYVVTFRQTDPLYTIDLSDPKDPKLLGELKLLGYSAYLHPLAGELMLGLGESAREDGLLGLGTQLSLFDVSDLRRPSRLQHRRIANYSSSEAESDHHAFLYWAPARLAVVPVETPGFSGAIGFRVTRQGIDKVGQVEHPKPPPVPTPPPYGGSTQFSGSTTGSTTSPVIATPTSVANGSPVIVQSYPIRRSLVVGDTLFTVSGLGVQANDLSTFAERGWIPFH